jgi:hypothetical protein
LTSQRNFAWRETPLQTKGILLGNGSAITLRCARRHSSGGSALFLSRDKISPYRGGATTCPTTKETTATTRRIGARVGEAESKKLSYFRPAVSADSDSTSERIQQAEIQLPSGFSGYTRSLANPFAISVLPKVRSRP